MAALIEMAITLQFNRCCEKKHPNKNLFVNEENQLNRIKSYVENNYTSAEI